MSVQTLPSFLGAFARTFAEALADLLMIAGVGSDAAVVNATGDQAVLRSDTREPGSKYSSSTAPPAAPCPDPFSGVRLMQKFVKLA